MTFPLSSPAPPNAYHTYLFQWTDRSSDEDGFQLWARVGSSGSFSSLGTLAANSTLISTELNVFPAGTPLQFKIRAFKGVPSPKEYSAYSDIASVVVPSASDFSAPTSLAAANGERDNLRLTWTDNAEQEEYYAIEYKLPSAADWRFYALPFFNIQEFDLNSGLDPGATYDFRVRGLRVQPNTRLAYNPAIGQLAHVTYDSNGQNPVYTQTQLSYSASSNVVTHTIPALSSTPGLLAGEALDENTIRLAWFDRSDKEMGYAIEYKEVSDASFATLDYTAPNATSFQIDTPPGATFQWQVRGAYQITNPSTVVTSPPSNTVTLTAPFHAPTALTATASPDSDEVTFTWQDNSSVESGYELLALAAGHYTFSQLKTVGAGVTSTAVTGLVPGTNYDFLVRAYHSSGAVSGASNQVTLTTRNGISSRSYQAISPGQPFSYQVATSNALPRTSWEVEGLPAGLSFDSSTGIISGIATGFGVFPVTLRATFADGSTDESTVTLRSVRPAAPPVVSQLGTRTLAPGAPMNIPLSELFSDPDSEQAVRMETSLGNIDILLYPNATPLTVANFLAYATGNPTNNRYDGVAFHRVYASGAIDIIQGGAFKPASSPDQYQSVQAFPPVPNEPGISNRTGTIAMAKLGGQPDSATHDFFFNRTDSHSPTDENALDNQNGGFTVFGRVAGNGMSVVDQIASLPKGNYSIYLDGESSSTGPYAGWPINSSEAPSSMDNSLNVLVNQVTEIPVLNFEVTGNSNPTGVFASIEGESLVLSGPVSGESSEITVRATDLDGNTVSQTFVVQIDDAYHPPEISSQPANASAALGGAALLSVTADGSPALNYQWLKDGKPLYGETGNSLSFDPAGYEDQGSYSVTVSNQGGTVTSNSVTLTVTGAPVITRPPASLSRTYGYSATFSATAAGTGPLTYQWLRNGTAISAANGATYTISSIRASDAANYQVRVSNAHGEATSTAATLTVLSLDSDGDGLADHEELAARTDPKKPDTDGDGFDDGVEVAFGGNPLLAKTKPVLFFVARTQGAATLENLLWKRVPATPSPSTFQHSLSGDPADVPAFWMTAHELTNRQFASILQFAFANLPGVALSTLEGGRQAVTYQNELVCILPTHAAASPANLASDEVSLHPTAGFFVPVKVADYPARGITWHGAYLATVVMNAVSGYTGKSTPATWAYSPAANGVSLPGDAEWEWAARSGTANYLYPTGATVSTSLANYNGSYGKTKRVGSYKANAFGIYDLAGNVAEWLLTSDPVTPANAFTRGGGWADPAPALSNLNRSSVLKSTASNGNGVRLALKDDRTPAFTQSPSSRVVSRDQPLTFTLLASGAPKITNQWFKNGKSLKGQTAPTLSIPSPKLTDAGTYHAVLTNPLGTLPSAEVTAVIIDLPLAPQKSTVKPGSPVTFRVPFAGAGVSFAWKKDGIAVMDDDAHDIFSPGTFNGIASLTLLSPALADSGRYTCTASLPSVSSTVTVTFDLVVAAEPDLQLAAASPTVLNDEYTYDMGFDPHPLRRPTSFSITGLPPGLTYDPITGRISGRPLRSGTFPIFVTATNPGGTDTRFFNLTVQPLNANTVGTFVALVSPHTSINADLGGRLDFTTTSAGAYTGTLKLGATTYRFKGILDAEVNPTSGATAGGNATFKTTIPRRGLSSIELNATLNATTKLVTGTVKEVVTPATPAASLNGWRFVWSATNFPPATRLGSHNFALDIPEDLEGDPSIPQGYGTGTIQIPTKGTVAVRGQLSDGSVFTSSAPLGPDGQVVLFQLLYKNTGTFHGTLQVAADAFHHVSGSPTWRKGVQPAKERVYAAGFGLDPANPLLLTAGGGLYTPPAAGQLILGLPAIEAPATSEFIRLEFHGGGVPNPEQRLNVPSIPVRPVATITMPPSGTDNPASATLKVDPKTGVFSGKIRLADGSVTRLEAYQGLVVRDGDNALRGYGYFLMPQLPEGSQKITTTPKLSGGVVLEEKP